MSRPLRSLRAPNVDEEYDIKCSRGHWYRATVVQVAGAGDTRRIKVHYDPPWTKKHDKWITDASKVRKCREVEAVLLETALTVQKSTKGAIVHDGEVLYIVKALIKKKIVKAGVFILVQWESYEGEEDEFTWELPHNIDADLVAAFEEAEQEREDAKQAKSKPLPKKPPREKLRAHTLTTVGERSAELKDSYCSMAEFIEDELGQAASTIVGRASEPSAKKPRQFFDGPISEELYYGLHARCRVVCVMSCLWSHHARSEAPFECLCFLLSPEQFEAPARVTSHLGAGAELRSCDVRLVARVARQRCGVMNSSVQLIRDIPAVSTDVLSRW